MSRQIFGKISDSLSGGQPVQGLRVMAWDEDWPGGDDYMGRAYTDQQGNYSIRYAEGIWDAGLSSGQPDIYITLEIKNARDRWVHLGKSQVFRDHDLSQDLRVDMQVSLVPAEQHMTGFTAGEHGFHFKNSFQVKPQILNLELEEKGMGFCGGMCAGALQRYKHDLSPPGDHVPPTQGTPLFNELAQLQVRSMFPSVLAKMYQFQSAPDQVDQFRKTSIGELTRSEWPALKAALNSGNPTILVLIRASGTFDNPTKNHQVLATGYTYQPTTKDLLIDTYDPNKPDQPQTLSMNLGLPEGRLWMHDSAKTTTRGFFVSPVGETISK